VMPTIISANKKMVVILCLLYMTGVMHVQWRYWP
jgi:hypothetical protein